MVKPERAMVIVANTDDAEYLVSGLVSQWTRGGIEVTYAIVTNGDKGSEDPNATTEELARTRRQEQERAAKRLGVERVLFLGHEDGLLEPTTRFMTDTYPDHPDHRATGDATVDAVFPSADSSWSWGRCWRFRWPSPSRARPASRSASRRGARFSPSAS